MSKNLECDIVRDLLPSYADGLTSDATNKSVEEHLTDCAKCSEALRLMREPESPQKSQTVEVDYLKKVRRHTSSRSLLVGIALMLLGLSIFAFRIFYVGYSANASDVLFESSVDGNEVRLTARLASSGQGISRVTFNDSNGMVQVMVYTAPKAFFNHGDYMATYTAACDVSRIRIDDTVLWENGTEIDRTTARLFAEINPYVGDMTSNANIAHVLGIAEQLGNFTNELHTVTEPYGWTLYLEADIAANEESVARDIMAEDSYVLLATIGNLGYVTWQYSAESVNREYTVTADDASAFAGRDIKDFAESVSELQTLIGRLNLGRAVAGEVLQESGTFRLKVRNNSDVDIYGFSIDYYLDGKLLGTRAAENANGSVLDSGDEFDFEFVPNDFPPDTTAISLSAFSFDLYVTDKDGAKTIVRSGVPVTAKYAWCYDFSLTDAPDGGFTLTEG